jgi:outer membrane murein-binding lipoprotein Lpp
MKTHNMKMWAGAALITLFVMAGCAGKDEMGMHEMKKETMTSEMKTDSGMKKMDSKMDTMSHKKMNTDMEGEMPEQMESKMDEKMDTMKTEMDESMGSDMKKME